MPVPARYTDPRRSVERQDSVAPQAEGGAAPQAEGGAAPNAEGRRGVPKQALSADLLATLVERRLRWLPPVRAALARDRLCSPRPGLARRHARDAAGRNWDLRGFACGSIDETACPADFRTVVDRLRDEFDIA